MDDTQDPGETTEPNHSEERMYQATDLIEELMDEITHSLQDAPSHRDRAFRDFVLEALQALHTLLVAPTAEDVDEKDGNLGGHPMKSHDK